MLFPKFETRDLMFNCHRVQLHLVDNGTFKDRNATPL
jgi:hypothetical protein